MSKKHKIKPAVAVNNRTADPYITLGAGRVENDAFWRWGDDNLMEIIPARRFPSMICAIKIP